MNRFAKLAIASTVTFALAACGGSDDSTADTPAAAADPVAAITRLLTDTGAPADEAACIANEIGSDADLGELAKLLDAAEAGDTGVNIEVETAVAFNDAVVACGLG